MLLPYHFSKSTSSTFTVSLLRKKAIRIPSPTAASAAASVITKMAKICPCRPQIRENATKFRFTAFRISSIDISTMTTLRRVSTPIKNGRASGRGREEISGGAGSLKKKKKEKSRDDDIDK